MQRSTILDRQEVISGLSCVVGGHIAVRLQLRLD